VRRRAGLVAARDVFKSGEAYTWGRAVRTNIEIDDDLLLEAMAATGLATKRATVEEALRQLVHQSRRREALRSMAGIGWDGDLDAMRRDTEAHA